MIRFAHTFSFWIFLLPLSAQEYITNAGFEGNHGIEVIPPDWFAGCGVMNTPDTQPGWWNIENKPAEGKSYINLLYKDDGTTESVYQQLAQPLDSGACYLIEVFLSQACQDSISDLYPYDLNHPGDLQIRGSETYGCGTGQVLAMFEQVSNCQWKKYYAVFQASQTIEYIYLEFTKGSSAFNNGSVLIDYFNLENLNPFEDKVIEGDFMEELTVSSTVSGMDYMWSIDDSLIAQDTSSFSLILNHNKKIVLTYYSADGCLIKETFLLYVKPQIPNIITANNDEINDIFLIQGMIEDASLSIVNRWGQLVYFDENYSNNWEPENLTAGVYFYTLFLKDTQRTFSGFVSIH